MKENRKAANDEYLERMGLVCWSLNIYPEDRDALKALGEVPGRFERRPMYMVIRRLLQEHREMEIELARLRKAVGNG